MTWDGPQDEYLRSLFLPIFAGLKAHGYVFHVLQFTWADAARRRAAADACAAHGFTYRDHGILRWPVGLGSLLTALSGFRAVRRAVRDLSVDIVMPRNTLSALATMLALGPNGSRPPLMVFDADGLPHDEHVDFAGWSPHSLSYRLLRDLETQAVRRANRVVTRSARASEILLARGGEGTDPRKFFTVTGGRDPELYKPLSRQERQARRAALGICAEAPLLVYSGPVGKKYCVEEVLAIFEHVHMARPDARFLFLAGSSDDARAIAATLQPVHAAAVTIRGIEPDEVPAYLGLGDVGLAIIRPSFSMQAAFPVKMGEYLLSGLPVVATRHVGDIDRVADGDAVCFIDDLGTKGIEAAASWILGKALPERAILAKQARALGLAEFGLETTVQLYAKALSELDCQSDTSKNRTSADVPRQH